MRENLQMSVQSFQERRPEDISEHCAGGYIIQYGMSYFMHAPGVRFG